MALRTADVPRIADYGVLLRCLDRAAGISRKLGWEAEEDSSRPTHPRDPGDDLLFVTGNRLGCLRGAPTEDGGYRACVAMPYAFGDFVCAVEADARSRNDRNLRLLADLLLYFLPLDEEPSRPSDPLWSGRIEVPPSAGPDSAEGAGAVRVLPEPGPGDFDWQSLPSAVACCGSCRGDLTCWIVCTAARVIECASRS